MNTFYFGGPTWLFLTPDQMYGEQGKLRAAHKHYQNADIYLLTKMRKVRFNPNKTWVTADGSIHIEVILGDQNGAHEKKRLVFPMHEIHYSLAHIREQFESSEHFFYYCLQRIYKPICRSAQLAYGLGKVLLQRRFFPKTALTLMRWAYARDVFVEHQDSYQITVFDPIAKEMTDVEKVEKQKAANPLQYQKKIELLNTNWDAERLGKIDFHKLRGKDQRGCMTLTVDQVVNYFEIDVGAQEVLYIGKTNREPFERLLPHEKLQQLEAEFLRNDEEALVVHLLGFKKIHLSDSFIGESKLPSTLATSLVEAELINYFKPVRNTTYISDSGKSEWDHVKALIASGCDQILGELDFDGNQYTKYVSQAARGSDSLGHKLVVDLAQYRKNHRTQKATSSG